MSKIAKYKLIDKNPKIIFPTSICFPLNPVIKKKTKKLKVCKFRKLELQMLDECFIISNYNQYIKNLCDFDSMKEKHDNSKKEYEQKSEDQMASQVNLINPFENLQKNMDINVFFKIICKYLTFLGNDEDSKQQEVIDFLQKSKTNFFKNIIYAFQNHILYQCDEQQKQ
ncbi:hypothetical protein ABPG72_022510 [Tetrahymena utriculariae]